jgi:hypothetical protein
LGCFVLVWTCLSCNCWTYTPLTFPDVFISSSCLAAQLTNSSPMGTTLREPCS